MKKSLTLIILFTTIFLYGCSKSTNDESPISLYMIDINSLSNKNIIDVVNDNNLKEGAYQIITKNNNYIFFNGIDNDYVNISSKLHNKTLFVNCKATYSSQTTKKLYVIKNKNTTLSEKESPLYNIILIKIDNKKASFNSIYTFY